VGSQASCFAIRGCAQLPLCAISKQARGTAIVATVKINNAAIEQKISAWNQKPAPGP